MRYRTGLRLLVVTAMLARRPMTINEVATALECDYKTAQRNISALGRIFPLIDASLERDDNHPNVRVVRIERAAVRRFFGVEI